MEGQKMDKQRLDQLAERFDFGQQADGLAQACRQLLPYLKRVERKEVFSVLEMAKRVSSVHICVLQVRHHLGAELYDSVFQRQENRLCDRMDESGAGS
tara:strand:+ start:317 stop:610 length:294 start_codon:yes stop_codon:yes gene_type:complete